MTRHRPLSDYTLVVDTYVDTNEMYSRFTPDANSDCILYQGPFHRQGYGMFSGIRAHDERRIMFTVHRMLMKERLNRSLANHEMVIHTCSRPNCVNIDHLFVGTAKDRNQVMAKNGRSGTRVKGRGSKSKRPQNRKYKYSIEEMLWARYAGKEAVAARYSLPINRARQLIWNFTNKYLWLNQYDEIYQAKQQHKINITAE